MPLFSRRRTYDRARLLKEADAARSAGRKHLAIALLRRVLAVEPRNVELHARIAPLLARTGQHFEAWQSFDLAARACLDAGHPERALAVYREASRQLPRRYDAWRAVADLELRAQRPERARDALLEGRAKLRRRSQRPEAIALMRAAHELAPDDVGIVLDLSRLLARSRRAIEACSLLTEAAAIHEGRALRRVRGRLFACDPSLRSALAWLRAAWRSRGDRSVRVSPRARLATTRS